MCWQRMCFTGLEAEKDKAMTKVFVVQVATANDVFDFDDKEWDIDVTSPLFSRVFLGRVTVQNIEDMKAELLNTVREEAEDPDTAKDATWTLSRSTSGNDIDKDMSQWTLRDGPESEPYAYISIVKMEVEEN